MENSEKWFFSFLPKPEASVRLFCFPFAGGGASVFNKWGTLLRPCIEVWALRMPGREGRYAEPPACDFNHLISEIVDALEGFSPKPFAFFGYSFGALLAFEACRELRRRRRRLPEILFLGAVQEPHSVSILPPMGSLPEEEFVDMVERYFQPDDPAWKNLELRQLLLPILQMDIKLAEKYVCRQEEPLAVPLHLFYGRNDRSVDKNKIRGWSNQISKNSTYHPFTGSHFFINHFSEDIIQIIINTLQQ